MVFLPSFVEFSSSILSSNFVRRLNSSVILQNEIENSKISLTNFFTVSLLLIKEIPL